LIVVYNQFGQELKRHSAPGNRLVYDRWGKFNYDIFYSSSNNEIRRLICGQCLAPPSGLVSWWPGDGNASDIQSGNDGTLQIVHNRTNGATAEAVLFAAPPSNQLFYLAVTFDGAEVRAYYNGVEAALVSTTNTITAPLYTNRGWLFGRTTHPDYGGLGRFVGILDEIEIYNRALSASEIQSLYNAVSAGKCKECTPPDVSIAGPDPVCPNTTHTYTATTNANVIENALRE
jgi:hypothetical protein